MRTPLSNATVSIVGLGLMGGSLGLALEGRCARRIGLARRREVCERAVECGAVDYATIDISEAVGVSDIVVLALPVRGIISLMGDVAADMRPNSLLLDLGSTKRQIVEAMNGLPEHVLAVGGHPMCGKESSGLERADAALYSGATFVLTPTTRTDAAALASARELVEAVEARPLVMGADEHDTAAACISHLPYLVAGALMSTEMLAEETNPSVREMAAGGFRDATRLAASDTTMMLDTLLTNADAVRAALTSFERQIAEVRRLLDEPSRLESWMLSVRQARRRLFS